MSLEPDALARALHAIAVQDVPASRVDPVRACRDGRTVLRRRRAAAGLGGTCAVVFIAAAALSAGHVFGGGRIAAPATGAPATGVPVVHTADWDPLVVPATFGWLPANAQNIGYSGSSGPGPGQGPSALGKGSQVSDGQVGHDPAFIWLAALDPGAPAPKAGPLNDGSGMVFIAAPDVNGRAAYWAVDPVKRDPDTGASGGLYFQSPAGRWATIKAYNLGADPVVDTLLHIARTAHVGDYPVPLPVRISGLPKDAAAVVAEVDRPTTIPGAAWSVELNFGLAKSAGSVSVDVYPADATPFPGTSFGSPCKVSNGLRICAQTSGKTATALLPGGIDGFLHGITSLGPDPAHWTADAVVAGN